MENKKITTGFDKLISSGGYAKGELGLTMAPPYVNNNFVRFLPTKDEGTYMVTMPLDISEEVTKQGICVINEMLEKMKVEGFDTKSITKHEKLGDTVYPVTYHDNGMVTVDYPDRLFCDKIKNRK